MPHILAAVLQIEPDWNRLPKHLHPRLEFSLQRCLKKKPRERYHSIADARIDIEDVLNDPEGVEARADPTATGSARPSLPWLATAVVGTAAVTAVLAWILQPEPAPRPVNRFDYDLPADQSFANLGRRVIDLSPDGRHFVYSESESVSFYAP